MYRVIPLLLYISIVLFCFALPSGAADHAVILQYHHFGDDTPPSTSITMNQFKRHLAYLAENKYSVWPLDKILSHLKGQKPLPDNCVAITIDDAYVSVYEKAYPLLKEYGYPFTVFVPTEGVDGGIKSYLTWKQMREMQRYEAVFASHSHSHDYLIRRQPGESEAAWKERVTTDIRQSLKLLKEKLGSDSKLFAYPYGEYTTVLKEIIRGLGLTGVGQQSGAIRSGSDFAVLPRFPMAAHYAEQEQFITKIRSLPLPVISATPDDPVLTHDTPIPVMQLHLAPGDYIPDSLSCFIGGLKAGVYWLDKNNLIVEVRADKPLPAGRSRYNCTARHTKNDRYFWYSHLWIRD